MLGNIACREEEEEVEEECEDREGDIRVVTRP